MIENFQNFCLFCLFNPFIVLGEKHRTLMTPSTLSYLQLDFPVSIKQSINYLTQEISARPVASACLVLLTNSDNVAAV